MIAATPTTSAATMKQYLRRKLGEGWHASPEVDPAKFSLRIYVAFIGDNVEAAPTNLVAVHDDFLLVMQDGAEIMLPYAAIKAVIFPAATP